jgi:hypothetical protein
VSTFDPAQLLSPQRTGSIDLFHQQKRGPSVLRHAQTASRSLSFGTRTFDWCGIETAQLDGRHTYISSHHLEPEFCLHSLTRQQQQHAVESPLDAQSWLSLR